MPNKIIKVAYCGKHFGEEPPLVGNKDQGAGAIFFCGCNMHCVFCQNKQISQGFIGQMISVDDLAKKILELQNENCVCIDLVTPTIWQEQIIEALKLAKQNGLQIPVVWNSNGYEKVEDLRRLKDLVDIYLPDFKYSDNEVAFKYSGVKDYFETTQKALKEMFDQVGNLKIAENGLAVKGLLVRHLVLPNNLANSFGVLQKLAEIDKGIHVSLMNQYLPLFVENFLEINRKLNHDEFAQVLDYQLELGLKNGFCQEFDSSEDFVPDFEKDQPFICPHMF